MKHSHQKNEVSSLAKGSPPTCIMAPSYDYTLPSLLNAQVFQTYVISRLTSWCFLMIAPTACIPILSQTFPTPCLDVVGKYDFLFNSLKTDFFLFWIISQDCCPTNLISSWCQWLRREILSFLPFRICFWIFANIFLIQVSISLFLFPHWDCHWATINLFLIFFYFLFIYVSVISFSLLQEAHVFLQIEKNWYRWSWQCCCVPGITISFSCHGNCFLCGQWTACNGSGSWQSSI